MRKLGEIDVVGVVTRVVRATKEEAGPDCIDERGFAAYEAETCTIYLREWDKKRPPAGVWSDLVHEFVHVALWENGGTELLRQALPHLSYEARSDIEEALVRALSPAIVTAFPGLINLHASIKKAARTK